MVQVCLAGNLAAKQTKNESGDENKYAGKHALTCRFVLRNERPVHVRAEETRVYRKERGQWMMVHFHRSGGHNSLPVN